MRIAIVICLATQIAMGSLPALAHQAFRLNSSPSNIPSTPELPIVSPSAVFQHQRCSIYESAKGGSFYVLPTHLQHIPSQLTTIFGTALESERQDHIVIVALHAADTKMIQSCIDEFIATRSSNTLVQFYPATVTDVTLTSDPGDHLILKFNYGQTPFTNLGAGFQVLSIIQASSRRNVNALKRLLSLQIDAVAHTQIRVASEGGGSEYRTLSIPLALGGISVSSQGL